MRAKNRLVRLVTVLLSLVMASVVFTSPVMASSCDPGRSAQSGTWFAGSEETDFPTVTGIRANVWESDVYVSLTTNVPTSSWVMLNAGPGQLAQVGWLEQAFNARKVFVQFLDASGNYPLYKYDPLAEDQFTTYQVLYSHTSGNFGFYVDGVKKLGPPASFNPSKSQVMGELKNLNNQMPGIPSSKHVFASANRRSGDQSTWLTFYGDNAGTSNNNYFSFQRVGNDTLIWDDC